MLKNKKGFTLIELLAVVIILGILVLVAVPTITNVVKKAREKAFESQAKMIIGAARNASIENPNKTCYTLSELSNYINKDLSGYSGSVLLDKENKVNKIWLSKNPYIINGSVEEEIEVIELVQYQEASTICEDVEILDNLENPANYTLVINPDGGIHDGHENNEGYELTKNGTKTITEPTKFGYVFDGWEVTGTPTSFTDGLFVMGEENILIKAKWEPLFAYTGTYTLLNDGDGNWRIKLLTSGTLTPNIDLVIDIFLVGGGAGGRNGSGPGGSGGGAGYTNTFVSKNLTIDTNYSVVVGSGGGATANGSASSFTIGENSYSANGGNGVNGGSGGGAGGASAKGGSNAPGAGGTNGGNGAKNGANSGTNGTGQGSTTREFSETSESLYAAGGNGGHGKFCQDLNGDGSYNTCNCSSANGSVGTANTGTGGGGGACSGTGGAGGSGIVIIRNHR